jgi:hypothetical protein
MTKPKTSESHPAHTNPNPNEDTAMTTMPPATPTSLATANEISEPEIEATFRHFLAIALEIPADQVRSARVNFTNVVQNAATGVAALAPFRDKIAKLEDVSLEKIDAVAKIGQAFQYAVTRVDRHEPIPGDIRERLLEAHKLRAMMFAKVDVLVLDGIIPESEVAGIRKGRGPIDMAGDCVALTALIRKYASQIVGHAMITAEDLQTASDLGAQLLTELRSATAPAKTKQQEETAEVRDRLYTLFVQTWEQNVWRAGAWVFGRDVDDHIPALGSRRHAKSEPAAPQPTPAPAPAPTPAPTPAPVMTASATALPHESAGK